MDTQTIDILILGVGRSKDKKKSVLDYALVDLKESTNRKGYNVSQSWFDTDKIFNQIKNTDIGKTFQADVRFEVGSNNHVRMVIENVYN